MALEGYVRPGLGFVLRGPLRRDELFAMLAHHAAEALPELDETVVLAALVEREAKSTTATRDGVAFPHAIAESATQLLVIPVVVSGGVRFTESSTPATLILFTVGARRDPSQHIRVLARLSRCVLQQSVRERLTRAADGTALVELLLAEDRAHG